MNKHRFIFSVLTLLVAATLVNCSSKSKSPTESGAAPGHSVSAEILEESTGAAEKPEAGATTVPAELKSSPGGLPATPSTLSDTKYKALAQALRTGGKVQEETVRILGVNPNDAVALNTLALIHLRHGRPAAAKLLISRALEKNPPNASLLNNLGIALLDEGAQEAAVVQFKKALQLDEHHTEALGNIGSIYAQGGDYSKALTFLDKSYKQNRGNLAVANNYAISLRVTKDYEGALKVYQELLKTNSREIPVLLNCAILYIDYMNKPKEGLDLVYKVKLLETSRKDVLNRANALAKKAESELK